MIGREREREELLRRYHQNKPEFIAVYGRRRVGKTTLVAETFQDQFAFRHAGLSPMEGSQQGATKAQLQHFYQSLKHAGLKNASEPKNWLEAFYQLETLLEQKDDGSRQVVFIDELPWLDTKRSNFMTALESFWNSWGCFRKN